MTDEVLVKNLLAAVQIYADADAFRRDDFGRPVYLEMKPQHDELYQTAINLKLATGLVVMQRRRPLDGLLAVSRVAVERPKWHPANPSPSKNPLLFAAVAAFQRSWLGLRRTVETSPKIGPIWHDDPALVFEPSAGTFMCRAACVGHEGQVIYFAYPKEREWLSVLARASLALVGEGESSYRQYLPKPGTFAE